MLGEHVRGWDALIARSPAQHRQRGIDVRINTDVTHIDTARREVHWRDLESGREGRDGFDRLVYATGAAERRPDIPGVDLGHFVHSPRQAQRLGSAMAGVQHVLIAGGGYIGLEMVEAFLRRGAAVELVTRSERIMRRTFDPDMSGLIETALVSEGVGVRCGVTLTGIEQHGPRFLAHTDDGEIETDLVVMGLGSRPRSKLAHEAGIPLGATGALAVDHAQRTRVEGIYAAGDCAEAWHRVQQRWVNYHLGTIANKAGRVAGINVAGGDARFPGVLGTAISRTCSAEGARTGLTETEAAELGIPVRARRIETSTTAGYMPEATPMHLKLVAEATSGRLLGGQILGGPGAGKRIDSIATAITAGLSVQDMIDLDLAYAPPFSGVWDPVQTAARVLA
ncbi:MAG: NADPH-dependent 2,4-dienoyl-CoA reductase, sulfur reductase [Chloroflexi bacterium]|nr:MAG: NADPH-dependent 2,4-dienoyl-CoA reductase, sulfur reductase [Chloroflexota bacterium]